MGSLLQGLHIIVRTVIQSLPDMMNVILLLLLVFFVFGIVGVSLFGTALPEYFGGMSAGALTLSLIDLIA